MVSHSASPEGGSEGKGEAVTKLEREVWRQMQGRSETSNAQEKKMKRLGRLASQSAVKSDAFMNLRYHREAVYPLWLFGVSGAGLGGKGKQGFEALA